MAVYNPFNKVTRPVFIVGCGRSGTTLLFDILGQHSGLVQTRGYPDGEDHVGWIKHGHCVMAGLGNVNHEDHGNGINGEQYCLHMTEDHVNDEIVESMHRYYRQDVLGLSIGKRVLNKQPHLSNKLRYVLDIFPDAMIVHIVRDCRPTVASWIAAMDIHPTLTIYWPKDEPYPCLWLIPKPAIPGAQELLKDHSQFYPGGGAGLFVDYWNKINLGIPEQMKGRESQLVTVRYEDLVAAPETTCEKILESVGLDVFQFDLEHVVGDRHSAHNDLISEDLEKQIATESASTREVFGYESQ